MAALLVSACGGPGSKGKSPTPEEAGRNNAQILNAQATAQTLVYTANAQATGRAIISIANATATALVESAQIPAGRPTQVTQPVVIAAVTPAATRTPAPRPKETATPIPDPTGTLVPSRTPAPTSTSAREKTSEPPPTATSTPVAATRTPIPTATPLPPTPTLAPTATPTPEPTPTNTPVPTITLYANPTSTDTVPLQARPDRTSPTIFNIERGKRVQAREQPVTAADGSEWYRAVYESEDGFILASSLSKKKPGPNSPTDDSLITLYVDTAARGFKGANVRAEPSIDGEVVGDLDNGESVQAAPDAVQNEAGESWYKVVYEGQTAYMLDRTLSPDPPANAIPTAGTPEVSPPPRDTPTSVSPSTRAREVTYTVSGTAAPARITYLNGSGGQSVTEIGTLPWSETVTTGSGYLYLYASSAAEAPNSLTCEISVDGKVVDTTTTDAPYNGYFVECVYNVP